MNNKELTITCKTNQPSYKARDIIYFKVYIWDKESKKPLDSSQISNRFKISKLKIKLFDYKMRTLKSISSLKLHHDFSCVIGRYETERFLKPGKYIVWVIYNGVRVDLTLFHIFSEVHKKNILLLYADKREIFFGDTVTFDVRIKTEQKLKAKFQVDIQIKDEKGIIIEEKKVK